MVACMYVCMLAGQMVQKPIQQPVPQQTPAQQFPNMTQIPQQQQYQPVWQGKKS